MIGKQLTSGGGEKLKKKMLGVIVSLLVVTIVVLPMSVAYATKPTEVQGELWMDPTIMNYATRRDLGNSNNAILTYTDAPFEITGGIEGDGLYNGKWLAKYEPPTPFPVSVVSNGVYNMTVKVAGKSGELIVGIHQNQKITIISGTEGLENLHGTGQIESIPGTFGLGYTYNMTIHFDP